MEDYDLWIRIRKQNKRFYNCPQITVKHRVHNLSAFNSGGKKSLIKKRLITQESYSILDGINLLYYF